MVLDGEGFALLAAPFCDLSGRLLILQQSPASNEDKANRYPFKCCSCTHSRAALLNESKHSRLNTQVLITQISVRSLKKQTLCRLSTQQRGSGSKLTFFNSVTCAGN